MNLAMQFRAQNRAKKISQSELVTLPSGAQVRLAPISLERFFTSGSLPQGILDKVKFLGSDPAEMVNSMTDEEISFVLNFMRGVVTDAVVEPRLVDVVENPDEEVALTEIENDDYFFIFNRATGGIDRQHQTTATPSKSVADFQAHQRKSAARRSSKQ